jgi:hypothetical protein
MFCLLASAGALLTSACDSGGGGRVAKACNGSESTPSRLFLQQLTDNSVIIKWRGAADKVCIGDSQAALRQELTATTTAGNHKEVKVTGLAADKRYYYSIGAAATAPAGQTFITAPAPGQTPADGSVRIWIVGDSGTASDGHHVGMAESVRDGFLAYNNRTGNPNVDLFLMLGDNAYNVGSDANYQVAVFDTYRAILTSTSLWSTIGNHEMGEGVIDTGTSVIKFGGGSTSTNPSTYSDGDPATIDNGLPYLDIFTFPTAAEAGGVPSGTEQYYSFNYGNVHVVNLDSQLTARDNDARAAMKDWLVSDLAANTLDWTIVIFHHPPYSKGANHDSDKARTQLFGIDVPQADMREEFVPVFDAYGVDLVYSGHAHSYERSWYLHGHTGTSDTFTPALHAELGAGSAPALGSGNEEYSQLSRSTGVDDKVVYSVNGSSGKADIGPLNHPAHRSFTPDTAAGIYSNGLAMLGSVVVDASSSKLRAHFIDTNGEVRDEVVINR